MKVRDVCKHALMLRRVYAILWVAEITSFTRLRISLQRFAQHDRFVNAAAKTDARLPPIFDRSLL